MNKLNIGCGNDIKPASEGWINLDKIALTGVDVVYDISKPQWLVFEDNTFDYVEAVSVLEHLPDWTLAMEEIWRISKPGAKVYIEVPFFPSLYSCIDPTHKSFFTYYTFEYFEPDHKYNYYFKSRFKITNRYIRFSYNKMLNLMAIPVNRFPKFYSRFLAFIFPSNGLEIELTVIK